MKQESPRVVRIVRWSLAPAAIVYIWWVIVAQWGGSDTRLFNWATVLAAVLLGIVTIAWITSIKWTRLQRALAPLEAGLVVGALVMGLSTSGQEVDQMGDHAAIAVTMGVVAAIVVGFVLPLVEHRRRAWAWMIGAMAICAGIGIVVPAALDWYGTGSDEIPEAMVPDTALSNVLPRLAHDGVQLTSSYITTGTTSLDTGYVGDPFALQSPMENAGSASVGSDVAAAPVAVQEAGEWASLRVQADGSVRVRVSPVIAGAASTDAQVSIDRARCSEVGDDTQVVRFAVPKQAGIVEKATPLTLDDLDDDTQIRAVIGTGAALAPVRCVELVDATGLKLARAGAASFHAECIEPLGIKRDAIGSLRPSSFQDSACAKRLQQYVDIASEGIDTHLGAAYEPGQQIM